MSGPETIEIPRGGPVAPVSFNRPDTLPAIDSVLREGLKATPRGACAVEARLPADCGRSSDAETASAGALRRKHPAFSGH